jgi:hypothetical protein
MDNKIILTEQEARTILLALDSAIRTLSRGAEKAGPPYSIEMEKRMTEFKELINIINYRLQTKSSRRAKVFDLDF